MTPTHTETIRRIRTFSEDGYELANISCEDAKWAVIHPAPVPSVIRVSPSVWIDDTCVIGYIENDDDLAKYHPQSGEIIMLREELHELLKSITLETPYP
jgi:hypothetical protein